MGVVFLNLSPANSGPPAGQTFSNPVLFNNIFWENEAFFFDPNNPQGPPGATNPGLFPAGFIDLEVFGTSGTLNPQFSLLTVPYGSATNNIVGQDPLFVEPLPNSVEARPFRLNPDEIFLEFIRDHLLDGNYHLQTAPVASPAINAGTAGPIAGVFPPDHDFDDDIRPFESLWDIGADEASDPATPPSQPVALLFFSTVGNAAVQGVASPYDDADIYQFTDDGDGTFSFQRVFDASTAGVPAAADIDALKMVDANTFYVSFNNNNNATVVGITLPGLGVVDDSDVVLYDNGTWTMFFDGSDVGLTTDGEDVDGFEILPGGTSILVSTLGTTDVPGVTGENRYDVLRCDASAGGFGPTTNCTWSMYFDGSDIGLGVAPPTALTDENIDDVKVEGSSIVFSTIGTFNVTSGAATLTGPDEDVWVCTGGTRGATSSCASLSTFFDGSVYGLTTDAGDIDAFETAVDPVGVVTAAAPAAVTTAGQ